MAILVVILKPPTISRTPPRRSARPVPIIYKRLLVKALELKAVVSIDIAIRPLSDYFLIAENSIRFLGLYKSYITIKGLSSVPQPLY